jgi:hypothetical protein
MAGMEITLKFNTQDMMHVVRDMEAAAKASPPRRFRLVVDGHEWDVDPEPLSLHHHNGMSELVVIGERVRK